MNCEGEEYHEATRGGKFGSMQEKEESCEDRAAKGKKSKEKKGNDAICEIERKIYDYS